jgi:xanthosine utilization system XapX-like protein
MPLDHSQASIPSQRTEAMLDARASAPSSESLVGELGALVGDEVSRAFRTLERTLQESSNRAEDGSVR